MELKGFDDWIPIFRGGKQKDSNGVEHDGNALMDKALANFNVATHEPPACIGHPADNAPAFGWVEGIKKEGNLLLAKFKQVQPAFADMVKQGLFKKRSAAFYPDGTLRHVGFLGAVPPAVKGLPDVAFAEGDATSFEFSDCWARSPNAPSVGLFGEQSLRSLADVLRRFREWLIVKEGQETADNIVPDWKIEELRSAANPPADESQPISYKEKEASNMNFREKIKTFLSSIGFDVSKIPDEAIPGEAPQASSKQFSEADIERIRTEAEEKGKKTAAAEFAENQKQTRLATIKTDIATFCETLIKAGKITPATVSFGLPEILFSLAESDNQIEFGEANALKGTREKATAFDRLKALLDTAKPLITFSEVATRDKDSGGGAAGTAGEKLDKLTVAKMKDNKSLSYSAAFAEAQKDNPDLAKEYQAEFQGE